MCGRLPTVVLDESHTQESRQLLDSFAASDVFALRSYATSTDAMYEAIRSGKARVGIRIPFDYARQLQDGSRRRCWCWWMGRTQR